MTIRPATAIEALYASTDPNLLNHINCIGFTYGNFGFSESNLCTTWESHNSELDTPEFQKQYAQVMQMFTTPDTEFSVFASRKELSRIYQNVSATNHTLRVDHEGYTYLITAFTESPILNIYCFCFKTDRFNENLKNTLELAKYLINQYSLEEFSSLADFTDLTSIAIGYTSIDDNQNQEHSVSLFVNLESPCIERYIDENCVERRAYPSIEDFIVEELVSLDFSTLISFDDDIINSLC